MEGWRGGWRMQLLLTSAHCATLGRAVIVFFPLRLPADMSAYPLDLIKNILLISPVLTSHYVL